MSLKTEGDIRMWWRETEIVIPASFSRLCSASALPSWRNEISAVRVPSGVIVG